MQQKQYILVKETTNPIILVVSNVLGEPTISTMKIDAKVWNLE